MRGIQLIVYICKNGNVRCTHMMSLSYQKSAYIKINYMQMSGGNSRILEFDYSIF